MLHRLVLLSVCFIYPMSGRYSKNWDRKGWPGSEIQMISQEIIFLYSLFVHEYVYYTTLKVEWSEPLCTVYEFSCTVPSGSPSATLTQFALNPLFSFYLQSSSLQWQYAENFFLQNLLEPRHQIHLGRIIPQNLTIDSAKVNLMKILLDGNLKYLRVKEKLSIKIFFLFYLWTCNLKKAWSKSKLKLKSRLHCSDINANHCNLAYSLQYQWCILYTQTIDPRRWVKRAI